MKDLGAIFILIAALLLPPSVRAGAAESVAASETTEYAGSERCALCHPDKYNDWKTSGHPYKLRPASIARHAPIPLPRGYGWDDISYVIGGFRWKAAYLDREGYIITTDKQGNPMATQWNMAAGAWVIYTPELSWQMGKKVPYDCGPCHTTGYRSDGHQDGLPGIIGTWSAPGIQCEACHGPGSEHIASADRADINLVSFHRASSLCARCHVRGRSLEIQAKEGFILHHEQYNEYLASPHGGVLECVICHDPHKPARFGIKVTCGSCHQKVEAEYSTSTMQRAQVACIDCHMPKASLSAGSVSTVEGDVRTHNWKISPDPGESMFTPDGKFAKGILTLDVVCLRCHANRDKPWAAREVAKGVHSLGK